MNTRILSAALTLVVATSAQAINLYSSTAQTGFRANPANADLIWFDDANIAVGLLGTCTNIKPTSVSVGFRRIANAPAVDVELYVAALDVNAALIPSSITSLGVESYGANGATSVTQIVTKPVSGVVLPLVFTTNYAYVVVGVRNTDATPTGNLQGWRMCNTIGNADWTGNNGLGTGSGAPNINLFWQWDRVALTQGTYWFGFTGANQATNPPACFYSVLDGTPVRSISGTVTLQDYSIDPAGTSVQWELLDAPGGTVLESGTTTLGAAGAYSVYTETVAGTGRVLAIKGNHWLKGGVESLDLTNNLTAVDFSLKNGDVDNDNEVGPGDFGELSSAFGSVDGDSNWNAAADLDGDGEVGPSDFGILSANFGEAGY